MRYAPESRPFIRMVLNFRRPNSCAVRTNLRSGPLVLVLSGTLLFTGRSRPRRSTMGFTWRGVHCGWLSNSFTRTQPTFATSPRVPAGAFGSLILAGRSTRARKVITVVCPTASRSRRKVTVRLPPLRTNAPGSVSSRSVWRTPSTVSDPGMKAAVAGKTSDTTTFVASPGPSLRTEIW